MGNPPSACPLTTTRRPVRRSAPRRRNLDSGSLIRQVLPSPRRWGDGSGCGSLPPPPCTHGLSPSSPVSKAQTADISQIADVKIQELWGLLIEEDPLGEVPGCLRQTATPPPDCRKQPPPTGGDQTADPRERQSLCGAGSWGDGPWGRGTGDDGQVGKLEPLWWVVWFGLVFPL